MKPLIVDSFGWIEFVSKGPLSKAYFEFVQNAQPSTHILPATIVYEVYKRVRQQQGESAALDYLADIQDKTTVIPLDGTLALEAADISLKEGLAFADSVVYATAIRFQGTVVTSDPHFKGKPNVHYIEK